MIRVVDDEAIPLEPKPLAGHVSEATLEKWIVTNPHLAGEPLLVLGSQLAEFAEDKDRLDVLAVDKQGELILMELKVDGEFRVTDLQALAYAAPEPWYVQVYNTYTLEPGGKTLGQIATEAELW